MPVVNHTLLPKPITSFAQFQFAYLLSSISQHVRFGSRQSNRIKASLAVNTLVEFTCPIPLSEVRIMNSAAVLGGSSQHEQNLHT